MARFVLGLSRATGILWRSASACFITPESALPTPIGWWSWTAYYFGISEGAALTNAEFLAAHLRDFGYNFFHIDEGYQYARGDYTSPVAYKFPHGVKAWKIRYVRLGLTPGIWTAPFEVSERSSVYAKITKIGSCTMPTASPFTPALSLRSPDTQQDLDPLYVLDTTNPRSAAVLA